MRLNDTESEETPKRDFLKAIEGIKDSGEREKEMKKGDFIKIPSDKFKRWIGDVIFGDEKSLDNSEEIEVKILEKKYTEDDFGNKSNKVLVEGGGVKKVVFASLFFNYGKPSDDSGDTDKVFVNGGSGFNQATDTDGLNYNVG
ncbi:MAG: hypothetical protein PHI66_00360 [Candidatus Pacebacteria bacterium]|nr:hypothetical protein [Candidatus Paceibacterota bacterium]